MKRSEPPTEATVSTMLFGPILLAIQTAGIDVQKFAEEVNLPLDALTDRDRRLPRDLLCRTWVAAGVATNDDVLGLHVAERASAGMYGALEYTIRSCPNLREGLDQFARYYRIVSELSTTTFETSADEIRICHDGDADTPPAIVDNLFVTIVRVGRELTGTSFTPREVNLTRAMPRSRDDHDRFFGVPVAFGCVRDVLVFDAARLELPVLTADANLNAALARRTEALLGTLPTSDRFLRRVRLAVIQSLQSGTGASLPVLARELDLSVRTLQRRLGENATTHSELIDRVRHDLAIGYLADDMSSTEAAYLLGFSEVAAFHRAFKRWTGTTTKEYRLHVHQTP